MMWAAVPGDTHNLLYYCVSEGLVVLLVFHTALTASRCQVLKQVYIYCNKRSKPACVDVSKFALHWLGSVQLAKQPQQHIPGSGELFGLCCFVIVFGLHNLSSLVESYPKVCKLETTIYSVLLVLGCYPCLVVLRTAVLHTNSFHLSMDNVCGSCTDKCNGKEDNIYAAVT